MKSHHSIASSPGKSAFWLALGSIMFAVLLTACGDNNNNNSKPEPTPTPTPPPVVDPEFPDYTIVTLEPGDDLETRALEALITASPKTIVEFPAGIYDFTSELSSSVDNIVIRGTGTDNESGTVLRFDNQTSGAPGCFCYRQ